MRSLQVKKLDPKARVPTRGSRGAAGWDLYALEYSVIPAGAAARVRTGIAVAIPQGLCGLVRPRSSARERGLDVEGTVDCDYRGEIFIQARNESIYNLEVAAGERIAQMVLVDYAADVTAAEVTELDETSRGRGGFGSTGR